MQIKILQSLKRFALKISRFANHIVCTKKVRHSKKNAVEVSSSNTPSAEDLLWQRISVLINEEKGWQNPDFDMALVCESLSTNKLYVSNAIRKHTGTTLSRYLNQRRVEYVAKELRRNPELSVKSLFYDAGFRDYSTGYRNFIQYQHISPSDFITKLGMVFLLIVASLCCHAQEPQLPLDPDCDVMNIPDSVLWEWPVGTDTTFYCNNFVINYKVISRDTIYADRVKQDYLTKSYTPLYLRSNLLLPLMNIGVEVPIGNRWSVAADWYYPWIPRCSNKAFSGSDHKNCFQVDGLMLEGRYWFGKKHAKGQENKQYRLTGHSVGLFAMGGRYDFERDYTGYQGEYIMGGVDYMFAKPIFKGKLHLELSLGVGYLHSRATKYEVYVPGGKGYRDKNFRKKIEYFGPLRASVALVVPIVIKKKIAKR